MESPEILLFLVLRENIVENPEIYLLGFYVLLLIFAFRVAVCGFLCVCGFFVLSCTAIPA